LAEGPGGFIEAFVFLRKNHFDTYRGMTLIDENINVPGWKKSETFLRNHSNVKIEKGADGTGNLYKTENLKYCMKKYQNSMEFITADGGFDFSVDFNNQETLSYKLILSQILYALIIQKKNGTFILKIFDIFKYKTIELIYLLSIFYDLVYIYKPSTSRIANSEKYLICKKFKGITNSFVNKILNNFDNIIINSDSFYSIFNFSISKNFLYKIKEVNAIYGQQQLENINTTLNFIREINNLKTLVTNDNIFNSESSYFFLKDIEILELLKINLDSSNNNFINDLYNISLDRDIFKSNSNLETDEYEKYIKSINKINNKLLILLLTNVQKCITWSTKYNIEINKSFIF
jgi:23S rRNA U2552 (ribose-2'-O)-methylase RlmE/FtsJ